MELLRTTKGYEVCNQGVTIAHISLPLLKGVAPAVSVNDITEGWQQVRLRWQVDAPIGQDELAIAFGLEFAPDFWWVPHLAPEPGDAIAQHVFRSPALIASREGLTVVIVPDLDICGNRAEVPWFMDLDAAAHTFWLGMSRTTLIRHVGYRREPGMVLPAGLLELGFYITVYIDQTTPQNPWSNVSHFLWQRYGQPLLNAGGALTVPMDRYVQHVYHWAFETWQDAVWQEFDLAGTRVGASAFIVNVTQSPNYRGEPNLREFLSIWNQAWFSSLRGASGVYRYARRTDDAMLFDRAALTKAFALAAPVCDGIFPAVFRTRMTTVEIEGKTYDRSEGWETGYWTNSDRTPRERGITDAWYHILDASWTALLMLKWYKELEADARLLDYARTYADKLLTLQDSKGFFPAWLHPETLEPTDILRESPETSMSVTFLLEMSSLTGDTRYRDAALRAMDAVLVEIVPSGRWEDFETYWSCCSFGKEEYLGKRFPRNAMFKQCNFSMFWTAEALLACYRVTGKRGYLDFGRRTLDELSMTQQVWQPPFIFIPALGGFGVMNYDGEWNDSRECLFAEVFMDYYGETGDLHLFERGIAALKSAFVMMYCPENPKAKALWEQVWPFFGPADYGFTMENYGHTGRVDSQGEGIGEFTIFDWGNGAAAEARNRIRDHYGDVYINRKYGHAFAIDSVNVIRTGSGFHLEVPGDALRDILVVYEDGTRATLTTSNGLRHFVL
jgi:hypothetical protein